MIIFCSQYFNVVFFAYKSGVGGLKVRGNTHFYVSWAGFSGVWAKGQILGGWGFGWVIVGYERKSIILRTIFKKRERLPQFSQKFFCGGRPEKY